MSLHFLLCPFNEQLIQRLGGKSIAPAIRNIEDLPKVVNIVKQAGAHLHCLRIYSKSPISTLPFKQDWRYIPIALFAPGVGRFADFIKLLPILRQLNLRIYLSTDFEENLTSIRILSSLGIETAVIFNIKKIDWEKLADLLSYAFFAQIPHANIYPFHYIATKYGKNCRTDFGAVYFDDPQTYLHLDESGHVALSQGDLEAGCFILENVEFIEQIEGNEEYHKGLEKWREVFLRGFGCASCPGWRICLGKFSAFQTVNKACREFFTEMMDKVEKYLEIKNRINQQNIIWQP